MEIETRSGRSLSTQLLQACIRPFGSRLVKPGKPLPAGSPKLSVPSSAKKHCHVSERNVEDTWLYDFVPKDETILREAKWRRVFYFAGGGFQSPPASQHWSLVAEMSCKIPALITIVSYPLAPNSPAKDSIPHLSKLYHTILEESESKDEIVTFMGDSAGGNVAICLVLYMLSKETEAKVPSSLFLISPCADARNTNPDMKVTDRLDPLLDSGYTDDVAAKWSIGLDRADPMVSPLLGDLEILRRRSIRLDGLLGTYDVLAPDALLLVEKAREAGVTGRWLKWDGQMHCFPLTWRYGLGDGIAGKNWIVDTVKSVQRG